MPAETIHAVFDADARDRPLGRFSDAYAALELARDLEREGRKVVILRRPEDALLKPASWVETYRTE
jgi:hypothetical protein